MMVVVYSLRGNSDGGSGVQSEGKLMMVVVYSLKGNSDDGSGVQSEGKQSNRW